LVYSQALPDGGNGVGHLEFQELLKRDGGYRTPSPARRGIADRLFGWSDAWFYINLIGIVADGNIAARRSAYGNSAFSRNSFQTLRLVERCGSTLAIEGCRNLASGSGPRVIVANHMSLLETFALPCLILPFGELSIVTRQDLLGYPLFGRVLRAVNPIAVTRSDPRTDLEIVLGGGEEAVKAGRSVLVFPQSTRMPVFDPAGFNTIGVKIARRAGVGVLPVALKTDFMGIGRKLRDFGPIRRDKPVRVRFGQEIAVTGNGREANEQCVSFIVDSLREWGQDIAGGVEQGGRPEDANG
jgi:1-acyl-sn-glycerol-3-phosphate acyltransferase